MRGDILDDIGQSSRDLVDFMRSQLRRSTSWPWTIQSLLIFSEFSRYHCIKHKVDGLFYYIWSWDDAYRSLITSSKCTVEMFHADRKRHWNEH